MQERTIALLSNIIEKGGLLSLDDYNEIVRLRDDLQSGRKSHDVRRKKTA